MTTSGTLDIGEVWADGRRRRHDHCEHRGQGWQRRGDHHHPYRKRPVFSPSLGSSGGQGGDGSLGAGSGGAGGNISIAANTGGMTLGTGWTYANGGSGGSNPGSMAHRAPTAPYVRPVEPRGSTVSGDVDFAGTWINGGKMNIAGSAGIGGGGTFLNDGILNMSGSGLRGQWRSAASRIVPRASSM